MAKIKKIQDSGETIYPATIFQAVKDPKSGQTLDKSFEGEHKKLTAGFAYEVLGDGQATSEKFSFRPTGGPNRNVRDGSARIEVLKGNSVVWNQKVKLSEYLPSTITKNGVTITNNNGTISVSTTSNGATADTTFVLGINQTAGHKMLISGAPTSSSLQTFYLIDEWSGYTDLGKGVIFTQNAQVSNVTFAVKAGVVIATPIVLAPIFTDLTQMFGAGNEPTTVEQFYELLPEGVDINAYNEGEIVDAHYKSVKTTGFNQWDEQWELGWIDNNGNDVATNAQIRPKGYIRILPNTNYHFTTPYVRFFLYDESKSVIGSAMGGRDFKTPSNAKYMRFTLNEGYGTIYKNDICINLAWDEYSALNGTYKPYKPFERDLSWVNKYFPATINGETKYGMRSAGNVADEIRFNSTTQQWEAVQRVGVRAYQSGDEADTAVTTDGKNTNYALATPDVKTITEDVNLAYDVADYGTEQLIVVEGAQSAPLSAEVVYEPNVLASIKQVAAMLTRLDALETAVATMQASAVATTNEE